MTSLKLAVNGILSNTSRSELNLRTCLKGGMSFRWTALVKENEKSPEPDCIEYMGVIGHKLFHLKQVNAKKDIEYAVYSRVGGEVLEKEVNNELRDYFRLDENLEKLYKEWSEKDAKFKEKVNSYSNVLSGIRVLRIDPVENLFSFICSSNNNIQR